MSQIIYVTLCILQYIFLITGQTIQITPPQDACVPSSVTLRCPNNYVVVVRNASFGVARVDGSCTYSLRDCLADGMSIVTCTTDTTQCLVYATKRKLTQCNDQFSSYIHLEYDCAPISMEDLASEYNVCQNGSEITSDHGIIRSPGYPAQSHTTTTTECFRVIHVPRKKTIRLWLTDLYIGSTSLTCANDHVYVVDSVRTYRYCGLTRYVLSIFMFIDDYYSIFSYNTTFNLSRNENVFRYS